MSSVAASPASATSALPGGAELAVKEEQSPTLAATSSSAQPAADPAQAQHTGVAIASILFEFVSIDTYTAALADVSAGRGRIGSLARMY